MAQMSFLLIAGWSDSTCHAAHFDHDSAIGCKAAYQLRSHELLIAGLGRLRCAGRNRLKGRLHALFVEEVRDRFRSFS